MKAARKNAGYTLQQAAPLLGIHWQTLSKYERGVIKKIPMAILENATKAYGESTERLSRDVVQPRKLSHSAVRPTVSAVTPREGEDSELDFVVSQVRQMTMRYNTRRLHHADAAELTRLRTALRTAIRHAFEAAASGEPQLDDVVEGMLGFLTAPGVADVIGEDAPVIVKESASSKPR